LWFPWSLGPRGWNSCFSEGLQPKL
jgi:hypothetical protein